MAAFLVHSGVAHTDDLLPVAAAVLLQDGAVAAAALERALESRLAASAVAPRADQEIASLAPSLLLLDPALASARHQCVPSRLSETAWWALYVDALLTAAGQRLLQLLRQERACGVLRELAGAPVRGDGQLSRLPEWALAQLACRLPAASVLSLSATSRALFALGHADVWRQLVARDFPDVEAGGRARYEAVARGRQGVPSGALEAVDAFLRARWGGRCCVYGGWGSPHLAVTMLWRSADAAAVRAEFEFKLDDGDTVWGERAAEELLLLAGGAPGAPRSWASTYAQGRPMAVEPLHGRLHGPPPQEAPPDAELQRGGCSAGSMDTEMTPTSDTDIV